VSEQMRKKIGRSASNLVLASEDSDIVKDLLVGEDGDPFEVQLDVIINLGWIHIQVSTQFCRRRRSHQRREE